MKVSSHLIVGIAAWKLVSPAVELPTWSPPEVLGVLAGAVLPDLDHPQSWLGRRLPVVSRALTSIAGHRGFTHSLAAVLSGIALLHTCGLTRDIIWPIVTGYLSHLAADALTPAGLPLFWPQRTRYAVPLFRTGSIAENLAMIGLTGWMISQSALNH